MKTFTQIVAQFSARLEEIPVSTRILSSLGFIAAIVAMIVIKVPPIWVGFIVSIASLYQQIHRKMWNFPEDRVWFFGTGVWYIVLYATIASIFY